MMRIRLPTSFAMILGAIACSADDVGNSDYCNIKIVDFAPIAPAIGVGDTLTLHVAYTIATSSCNPGVPASSLRWASSAPLILTVDSLSGKIAGRSAGSASAGVHVPGNSTFVGSVGVTVTGGTGPGYSRR